MFRAVLDTCALVPNLQRDFLLQLAAEEAFAPIWGTGILTELDYTLAELHKRRCVSDSEEKRRHLLAQMKYAFPGSEVTAPKDHTYHYGLNDPDDGHVAHAALVGKADAIITDDKRAGFKAAPILLDAEVEIVFPSEFAANTAAAHPEAGMRALIALSNRRTTPSQTPEQVLDQLVVRHGMDELADILSSLLEEGPR